MMSGPILLTGASGIVGRTYLQLYSKKKNIAGVCRTQEPGYISCDLRDPQQLESLWGRLRPSAIIHTAAMSNVDACEEDPASAYLSNAMTTRYLAQLAQADRVPFVHISTDYVFGADALDMYQETDAPFPINIYGQTKLAAEAFVSALRSPWAILRTSWIFGQSREGDFVTAIRQRLETQDQVPVLGDQVDRPTYSVDLCQAIDAILERCTEDKISGIYHFANQGATTRFEMAAFIAKVLGMNSKVVLTQSSSVQGRVALRPSRCVLNTSKFEETFSLPIRSWQDALKEYLSL